MTEHRCGAGNLCRDPHIEVVTGAREPAIIAEQRGLCHRCQRALRRAVDELVSDYERLGAESDPMASNATEHVSGTPEPSMPLNGTAEALRSTLAEWCEVALGMVAKPLNLTVRTRQRAKGESIHNYPTVNQAANTLPHNLDILIAAPDHSVKIWTNSGTRCDYVILNGLNVAVKIMQTHWKVTALLGETNPRRRLAMACPDIDCGAQTLGIANGETDVTCSTCGARWTESQYNWLAGIHIAEKKVREKATARTAFLLDLGKWLVAERDDKLKEVRRLAKLTEHQLDGIDGWAVVQLLQEVLDKEY